MENFRFVQTSGDVCVGIVFDVGSVVETEGEKGMAHVVEHMAFKTAHCLKENDFGRIAFRHGARFNAWTGFKNVGFYVECEPSDIALFSQLLVNICFGAKFRDDELQREMRTILDECNRRQNNFQTTLWKLVREMSGFCDIKHDPIGTLDDIVSMDAAKLQAFYDRYFVPSRAVFVLAAPTADLRPAITLPSPKEGSGVSAREVMRTQSCAPKKGVLKQTNMPDVTQPIIMFAWSMELTTSRNMDALAAAFDWINLAIDKNLLSSFSDVKFFSPTLSYEWVHPSQIGVMLSGKYENTTKIKWDRLKDVIKMLKMIDLGNVKLAWSNANKQKFTDLKHDAQSAVVLYGERFWDERVDVFKPVEQPNEPETRELIKKILGFIHKTECNTVVIHPDSNHSKYDAVIKNFQKYVDKWEGRSFTPPVVDTGSSAKDCPAEKKTQFVMPATPFDHEDVTVHLLATPRSFWFCPGNKNNLVMYDMMSVMNNFENTFLINDLEVFMNAQSRIIIRDLKAPRRTREEVKNLFKRIVTNASFEPKLINEWKISSLESLKTTEKMAQNVAYKLSLRSLWGEEIIDDIVEFAEKVDSQSLAQKWNRFCHQLDFVDRPLDRVLPPIKPVRFSHEESNRFNPTQAVVFLVFDLGVTLDSEEKVQSIFGWQHWLGSGFGSVLYDLRESNGLFYSIKCNAINSLESVNPKGSSCVLVVETITHPAKSAECVKVLLETIEKEFDAEYRDMGLVGLHREISSIKKRSLSSMCAESNSKMGGWDFAKLMKAPDSLALKICPKCVVKIVIA